MIRWQYMWIKYAWKGWNIFRPSKKPFKKRSWCLLIWLDFRKWIGPKTFQHTFHISKELCYSSWRNISLICQNLNCTPQILGTLLPTNLFLFSILLNWSSLTDFLKTMGEALAKTGSTPCWTAWEFWYW